MQCVGESCGTGRDRVHSGNCGSRCGWGLVGGDSEVRTVGGEVNEKGRAQKFRNL